MTVLGWTAVALLGLACARGPSDLELVAARSAERALPQGRGQCTIDLGRGRHDAVVLVDGARWHLAVLGELRAPLLVLRSDGQGVALTAGREHRVAEAAHEVLEASALPGLADLSGLLAGRLPPRPLRGLSRAPDGRVAVEQGGGAGTRWVSLVDEEGTVEVLSVTSAGGLDLLGVRRGPGKLPATLSVSGPGVFVQLVCSWEPLPQPPPGAFSLAPPSGVTSTRLEDLGWTVLGALSTRQRARAEGGKLPPDRRKP